MSEAAPAAALDQRPWWRQLNGYHWYVFALASLGWLFDTMDGQIFLASRSITMCDLLPADTGDIRREYGGYVTSIFILGWATGGIFFGMLGDRWGRAKTMALTILVYASFTGLCALSKTWWQFGIFRFLTGMGVGGEFAAGAALVAEVMPEKARAKALGLLQALSAVGNMIGASLFWYVEPRWGWQGLYVIGAFPALLAVIVRLGLKEPERWAAAKAAAKADGGRAHKLGSISDLFSPTWRRNTLVGFALGVAGVLGLWGAGFFSPELMDTSFPMLTVETRGRIEALVAQTDAGAQLAAIAALDDGEKPQYVDLVAKRLKAADTIPSDQALTTPLNPAQAQQVSVLLKKSLPPREMTALKAQGLILQQIGAFLGIMMFSVCATRWGRRPAFLFSFLIAWFSVAFVFLNFDEHHEVWYMYPLLGFGTLAPFGGYALYFPELFPTRLRTTGTGFCYNTGRFASALGPAALGYLGAGLHGKFDTAGFRLAAVAVSCTYLIGIVATIWAPETKDAPLPEDDQVAVH